MNGFWKTDHIVTLGLVDFIALANSYAYKLPMHCAIPSIAYWSAFLD